MVVACLIAIPPALAQETQGISLIDHGDDGGASVESARVAVRSATEWLASGVDSWFGSKPFSEGGKVSDGEIGLNLHTRQDQGSDASVRFNARFRLPNLEAKTYLFTGHDNWKGIITDKPAAFATKQRLLQSDTLADRALVLGIGRSLGESTDVRIGFKEGLTPFAQGRYRHQWLTTPEDEFEFTETCFLTAADRLGSSTTFSYQHQFSPTLVARWLNAVTVTQVDSNAEWNGSLGAYRSMGKQRLLSLEILASSKQNTGLALTDYGVQVRWEQPVDHDRLLGEIIVGHFWPQSVDASARSTAWALGVGLKMSF
jgi:hypothetical protein